MDEDRVIEDIGAASWVYCSEDKQQSFTDVQQQEFSPWSGQTINFGRRDDVCWVRFQIRNLSADASRYFLASRFAYIDRIDLLYQQDGELQRQNMGTAYALKERAFQSNLLMSRVNFAANESKTLYLRIEAENLLIAPISVYNEADYLAKVLLSQWLTGLYYGSLISLFLIAILLFYHFKDMAYVYYAAQLICVLMIFFNIDGISSYFLPNAAFLINYLHVFFTYAAIIMVMLFAYEYLQLSKVAVFKKATQIIFVLCMLGILLIYFVPVRINIYGTSITSIGFGVFLLSSSFYRLRQGMAEAKYFLLGWVVLVIGMLLVSLAAALNINIDIAQSIDMMKYFYLMQQVIFSLGLSTRIRVLKNKEHNARVEAVRVNSIMKTKNELFAKMSHEIRTPMTGVLGLLDLLKDTKLNDKQAVYVDTASSSATTLMSVINDVLDYSKIEAGKMVLAVSSFDIKKTLYESMDTFSVLMKEKDLRKVIEIADDFPDFIAGDEIRLRQILLNLLSNAVKFTDSGSIEITAKVDKMLSGNNCIISICVSDSGMGISGHVRDKMFQAYEQIDADISSNYTGTGLGLNICSQLIELMHGHIGVESQLGHGSQFTITFPAAIKSSMLEDKSAAAKQALPALYGMSVLIAEDNPVNQIVLDGMLKKLQLERHFASNGKQAFEAYCKYNDSIDVILMDCEMPEVDGLVATEMIREFEITQNLVMVSIVALTAQTSEDAIQKSLDAGMNDHLAKPVQLSVLANVIALLVS